MSNDKKKGSEGGKGRVRRQESSYCPQDGLPASHSFLQLLCLTPGMHKLDQASLVPSKRPLPF